MYFSNQKSIFLSSIFAFHMESTSVLILYPYHLLAIEKNGDSDDQGDQRNAITDEIYSRRDNLCTTLDRWLAKISTEAIVAIIAPDTVYPAPTTRVL